MKLVPHRSVFHHRFLAGLAVIALVAGFAVFGRAAPASASGASVFPGGPFIAADTGADQAAASLSGAQAAAARTIAAEPSSVWLGDWLTTAQLWQAVQKQLAAAASEGKTPVFVTYAIPDRACTGSSGLSPSQYAAWNGTLAAALTGHHAVVVVEPDALALLSTCPQDTASREGVLYNATKQLASVGATVYLDAGNSGWIPWNVMLPRMWASGLQFTRGFSTNVSNFNSTAQEQAYAEKIRAQSGKNYVIDVSRNGRGSNDGEWCNPWSAGLGPSPRVVNDGSGLDALLWIKDPGESDGYCNGGPAAGQWFASYAQNLVANR